MKVSSTQTLLVNKIIKVYKNLKVCTITSKSDAFKKWVLPGFFLAKERHHDQTTTAQFTSEKNTKFFYFYRDNKILVRYTSEINCHNDVSCDLGS